MKICLDDKMEEVSVDGTQMHDSFQFLCSHHTSRIYLYDKVINVAHFNFFSFQLNTLLIVYADIAVAKIGISVTIQKFSCESNFCLMFCKLLVFFTTALVRYV
jgi:hypothetical protein